MLTTVAVLVTLVTIHAVVNVPADIGVTEVGCVIVAVATSALEHRIVTRVRMAGCANPIRVPVIGREVRVIERRSRPARGRVAGIARRREAGGLVIRIRCALVVRLVASVTSCRQRRVVVVHVALRTGHVGRVIPRQRERGRTVIESRALPVREIVAGIARRREVHRGVRR